MSEPKKLFSRTLGGYPNGAKWMESAHEVAHLVVFRNGDLRRTICGKSFQIMWPSSGDSPTCGNCFNALRRRLQQGAVDLSKCTSRGRDCRCKPTCSICGYGPHVALHGPKYGEDPGSAPFDHEYRTTKKRRRTRSRGLTKRPPPDPDHPLLQPLVRRKKLPDA